MTIPMNSFCNPSTPSADDNPFFPHDQSRIRIHLDAQDHSFPLFYTPPSVPAPLHSFGPRIMSPAGVALNENSLVRDDLGANRVIVPDRSDQLWPSLVSASISPQANGPSSASPIGEGSFDAFLVQADVDPDDDMDDAASTTSSDMTEPEPDEFPGYFSEHNRRLFIFHSHGTTYPLPVDGVEWKRLEAEHKGLKILLGNNIYGPIDEILAYDVTATREKKVVDLCTGTGTWVLDMARRFEHVQFRGLDLAPIATRYPPDNVRFEITDVTKPLRFASNSVDFVQARHTMIGSNDYPRMLREAARILRPGGLFLSCEWGPYPALHPAHPNFASPETYIPHTANFFRAVRDNFNGKATPVPLLIPHFIRALGCFAEPVEQRFAVPIGRPYIPTPEALDDETRDGLAKLAEVFWHITGGFAQGMSMGLGPRVDPALACEYVWETKEKEGIVGVWHVTWARKL